MSKRLEDFLSSCDIILSDLRTKARNLTDLQNPWACPSEYLDYLANNIGFEISNNLKQALGDNYRLFIASAIQWYKLKGLYDSFNLISYILGFNVQLKDMWTNDYINFVAVDPSVNDYDQAHSGFYKSPHFGAEIVLDTEYGLPPNNYLFQEQMLVYFQEALEYVRPAHTVPHYGITSLHTATDFKGVHINPGNIQTTVTNSWTYTSKYFDTGEFFDNGGHFDWSDETLIEAVTTWKLGTGHKNEPPSPSWTNLENPQLEGTIEEKIVQHDRIFFKFSLNPNIIKMGITELGLFLSDNTMMVVSTFPTVDKILGCYWDITVEIIRQA